MLEEERKKVPNKSCTASFGRDREYNRYDGDEGKMILILSAIHTHTFVVVLCKSMPHSRGFTRTLGRVYFLPKHKKGLKKNARDNRAPSTVGKYLPSSFCTFFTCKSLAVWKVAMKQVRKQCISPSLCTGKGYINWARQIVKQVCFMVLGVSESFVSNRGNDVLLGITIWRVCIIYTVHTLQRDGP